MFVSEYVFIHLAVTKYHFDNHLVGTCSLGNSTIIENLFWHFQKLFDQFFCTITVMVVFLALMGIFHRTPDVKLCINHKQLNFIFQKLR